MRRGLYEWVVLAALAGSAAFGAGGGVFVVDGVPQRHAGLASVAYVDAHVPALSVVASNAFRLIQVNSQAWVTVAGGTATLWQVTVSTQLVCSGAGSAEVNGRYAGSVAGVYFENTTNGNIAVLGEDDSWFVYWNGGGGWMYHCFGSETPVGGTWRTDAGGAPAPVFAWGVVAVTNGSALARVEDLAPYATGAQLVAVSNALQSAIASAVGEYPVFELRLGGPWTDFEIKASTNNFAGGDMVYFYASGNANDYGADDPDPYTYYCDDFAADVRKWIAVAPHTAIATVLKNPLTEVETVYFYPSRSCQKAADSWMWKTNTHLVWSWVRYGVIGYETNANGTASHWNPIRPQSWEMSRTVP